MSESLLFAILGFLVACLIGTVFASFLWRRAVTVTTRRITADENFAAIDEVADLKADLRAAQNSVMTKDREINEAVAKTAELEAAIADAHATGEGTEANLKRELQNASEALMAAHAERDAAKAALGAKDAEIAEAKKRVTLLESAIRTLAQETSLLNDPEAISEPAGHAPTPTARATSEEQIAGTEKPASSESPTPPAEETQRPAAHSAPQTVTSNPASPADDRMEPSLAMTRSLEERIEALKQGERSAT